MVVSWGLSAPTFHACASDGVDSIVGCSRRVHSENRYGERVENLYWNARSLVAGNRLPEILLIVIDEIFRKRKPTVLEMTFPCRDRRKSRCTNPMRHIGAVIPVVAARIELQIGRQWLVLSIS